MITMYARNPRTWPTLNNDCWLVSLRQRPNEYEPFVNSDDLLASVKLVATVVGNGDAIQLSRENAEPAWNFLTAPEKAHSLAVVSQRRVIADMDIDSDWYRLEFPITLEFDLGKAFTPRTIARRLRLFRPNNDAKST